MIGALEIDSSEEKFFLDTTDALTKTSDSKINESMNVASTSNVVKIYSWPDVQLVHTYKPYSGINSKIKSISWGKDGTWMAVVPPGGQTEVISIKETVKRLHSISVVEHPSCCAFQRSTKKNVAIGNETGQLFLYDMKAKGVRKVFPSASSNIFHLEYTAKDSYLIAGCDNGEIIIYSNMTFTSNKFKIPKSSSVSTLRCHPHKRNLIAAGSREGYVDVWDINITKTKYCTQGHDAAVIAVAFSPMTSAVVLTSGLDRQFCLFDANSNSCIAKTYVNNNVTALDFCPDGTNFALGCQDGKIHIYDCRKMDEPIKSVLAHDNQINNLLFKKLGLDDSLPNYTVEETIEKSTALHNSPSVESFTAYMNASMTPAQNPVQTPSRDKNANEAAGDSFLVALGLNSTSMMTSKNESALGVSGNVKKWMDNVKQSQVSTPNQPVQNEAAPPESAQSSLPIPSSTPVYLMDEHKNYISPIFSFNHTSTTAKPGININNLPDVQKLIKETIQEVVSEEIGKLKKELKHDFFEMTSGIRRHFLDLQMSIVKEFVEMENKVNKVRNEIIDGSAQYSEDVLLEENHRLRTEIALLREKFNGA